MYKRCPPFDLNPKKKTEKQTKLLPENITLQSHDQSRGVDTINASAILACGLPNFRMKIHI